MYPKTYLDRLAFTKQVSVPKNHCLRSIFIECNNIYKYRHIFHMILQKNLCIFMFSRVSKRRETLLEVDLSKNFGVRSVLDLFGEGNNVSQILTIVEECKEWSTILESRRLSWEEDCLTVNFSSTLVQRPSFGQETIAMVLYCQGCDTYWRLQSFGFFLRNLWASIWIFLQRVSSIWSESSPHRNRCYWVVDCEETIQKPIAMCSTGAGSFLEDGKTF